jgi:hypothetical protein
MSPIQKGGKTTFTKTVLEITKEPLAKLFISVILNGVKDLKHLKIRYSSLRSE